MAKRVWREEVRKVEHKGGALTGRTAGATIEAWAEDLGRVLGTARSEG
jgi:hypothetical protein